MKKKNGYKNLPKKKKINRLTHKVEGKGRQNKQEVQNNEN
jgi:hypothetical protein